MATPIKKRISLSIDPDLNRVLSDLAKKEGKPLATKVLDMVNSALEYHEDLILGMIAEKRVKENKLPYLSHEEFWKKASEKRKSKGK